MAEAGYIIVLRKGQSVLEGIPRLLVEEVLGSLPYPDEQPPSKGAEIAKKLTVWKEVTQDELIHSDAIRILIDELSHYSHDNAKLAVEIGMQGYLSQSTNGEVVGIAGQDDNRPKTYWTSLLAISLRRLLICKAVGMQLCIVPKEV